MTPVDPTGAAEDGPVRFSDVVHLTKGEAFRACQVLADADRLLVRAGQLPVADALGDLFELFEERLSVVGRAAPTGRH